MKTVFSVLILVFCNHCLYSQSIIDISSNALRNGDMLNKAQISFVNPGERGTDQVWQLGHFNNRSKTIQQEITSAGDTVVIFEADQIRHYCMQGDTLCNKGEQSQRSFMLYDTLRPVLCYPFHFGDSISGSYSGVGRNENALVSRSGQGYSVADGTGILTDGTDTLYNALRIHFHEDFTDTHFSADTIPVRFVSDRYAWFIAGCRYPVQESRNWFVEDGDSLLCFDSQTFLYLPEAQNELSYDHVNDSIRSDSHSLHMSVSPQENTLSNFQARISNTGSSLDFSFSLSKTCDFSLVACDVMGNVLCTLHRPGYASGDWQESITLSRHPIGNTLMVNVRCDEQETGFKVSK